MTQLDPTAAYDSTADTPSATTPRDDRESFTPTGPMYFVECLEGAPEVFVAPHNTHGDCPCRKTGPHRVHRCSHGTEWWQRRDEPGVARVLVKLLEDTADDVDANLGHIETSSEQYALEIARLVLEAK